MDRQWLPIAVSKCRRGNGPFKPGLLPYQFPALPYLSYFYCYRLLTGRSLIPPVFRQPVMILDYPYQFLYSAAAVIVFNLSKYCALSPFRACGLFRLRVITAGVRNGRLHPRWTVPGEMDRLYGNLPGPSAGMDLCRCFSIPAFLLQRRLQKNLTVWQKYFPCRPGAPAPGWLRVSVSKSPLLHPFKKGRCRKTYI